MSKIVNRSYSEFYSKNSYFPKYFNPYNMKDLSVPYEGGVAPTVSTCACSTNSSATVLIMEEVKDDSM